jgi:hypothetical protein
MISRRPVGAGAGGGITCAAGGVVAAAGGGVVAAGGASDDAGAGTVTVDVPLLEVSAVEVALTERVPGA